MQITVNGQSTPLDSALSVSDLLVAHKVKMPDMVSVEINGTILRREAFDTTPLKEGDQVEFLYFMGGGL